MQSQIPSDPSILMVDQLVQNILSPAEHPENPTEPRKRGGQRGPRGPYKKTKNSLEGKKKRTYQRKTHIKKPRKPYVRNVKRDYQQRVVNMEKFVFRIPKDSAGFKLATQIINFMNTKNAGQAITWEIIRPYISTPEFIKSQSDVKSRRFYDVSASLVGLGLLEKKNVSFIITHKVQDGPLMARSFSALLIRQMVGCIERNDTQFFIRDIVAQISRAYPQTGNTDHIQRRCYQAITILTALGWVSKQTQFGKNHLYTRTVSFPVGIFTNYFVGPIINEDQHPDNLFPNKPITIPTLRAQQQLQGPIKLPKVDESFIQNVFGAFKRCEPKENPDNFGLFFDDDEE